jgi:hypothetical protein
LQIGLDAFGYGAKVQVAGELEDELYGVAALPLSFDEAGGNRQPKLHQMWR